jgi:glycosyltransferase family protein
MLLLGLQKRYYNKVMSTYPSRPLLKCIYNLIHTIKDIVRNLLPLSIRIKIGPFFAWLSYLMRIYITKSKKWPTVLSPEATLDVVYKNELSLIRFGDGEISLIENENLGFQKSNTQLSNALRHIIPNRDSKLLLCIPNIFGKLDQYSKVSRNFSLHHVFKHGHTWSNLLDKKYVYGDAFITRPYLIYKNKETSAVVFNKLFRLWENRDVLLIEGDGSRLGVGNDMFKNVKHISRILCPSENAFEKYEDILEKALYVSKSTLILLSLGPTAKALGYELFQRGYRVLDIGHIDMEYEMFLRKSPVLKKVNNKYFNEINERTPEACNDPEYLSQIIARIK